MSGKAGERSSPRSKHTHRDEKAMDQIFTAHSPIDSVIHFAGLKAVGESVALPLLYYENNIGSTITLLKVHTAPLSTAIASRAAAPSWWVGPNRFGWRCARFRDGAGHAAASGPQARLLFIGDRLRRPQGTALVLVSVRRPGLADALGFCHRLQSVPITEEAELHATNPYGRTKQFIEEIIRDYAVPNPSTLSPPSSPTLAGL